MFWTWDSYGADAKAHLPDGSRPRHDEQPLSGYVRTIDRLFYSAVAALAACLVALLID